MNDPAVPTDISAYSEILALAVFVTGIVAARLASLGTGAALNALDRRLARISTSEAGAISPRLIKLSRAVVFWLVLVLAVALSLRLLGVGGISRLLTGLIDFIPQLLVALAIVVAGHLLGLLASGLLTQFYDDIPPDSLGPKLLHGIFVAVAVVMGLQQIDINITFITQLLLILIGVVSGGLMLAFALGARRHVANLLAHRELDRLSIGERIRIGDVEGTIVEIRTTGVDVSTDDGIVSVPSAQFADTRVLRIPEEQSDA
ncbi:MAG: mechanosensitive ion channel [Woeseiaceae bacterium]|nr:mechanosensitive ion channel [Woeseiaceae bacterium]